MPYSTPFSLEALPHYGFSPMSEAALDGVMAIESCSFGVNHWSKEAFRNEMANQMAHYEVLVCPPNRIKDGHPTVLGYYGTWVVLDEGHLTTIASHPACRGLSLGELSFLRAMAWFTSRNAKTVTLEVRLSNIAAQNLYYKYQFTLEGRRRCYYQDNDEDALLLTSPVIQHPTYQQVLLAGRQRLADKLGADLIAGHTVTP